MPKLKAREFIDQIDLASGHSLIAGYKPSIVSHNELSKKLDNHIQNMDLEKFGLFDMSSPNYTTYYPDVTAKDINPTDDEFIEPTFRLISSAIVHKQWNPIDFGEKNVLKKTMNLLVGQTVNPDHETPVGNALGAVKEVFWQKEIKTTIEGKEVIIPAGINGILKIDAKSNPRIARGILMDPPSIHSNSVTVRFKWVKSHSDMEDNEFWNKLATYDDKGIMIRRIVTSVLSYHETSLVSHGADVFAQKIGDNGIIVNPKYSDAVYNLSATQIENTQGKKDFAFNWKSDITSLSEATTLNSLINNKSENNKSTSMKDIMALAALIGFTLDQDNGITEENFEAEFGKSLKESADKIENLEAAKIIADTDKQTLTTQVVGLEAEIVTLKKKEGIADGALSAAKIRSKELYIALQGGEDKSDTSMLKVIEDADYLTATSLLASFEKQAEERFQATCNACQSTDINRASASLNSDGVILPKNGKGEEELDDKPTSRQSLKDKIATKKKNKK